MRKIAAKKMDGSRVGMNWRQDLQQCPCYKPDQARKHARDPLKRAQSLGDTNRLLRRCTNGSYLTCGALGESLLSHPRSVFLYKGSGDSTVPMTRQSCRSQEKLTATSTGLGPQKVFHRYSPSSVISGLCASTYGTRLLGVWVFNCKIIGKAAQSAHCYLKRRKAMQRGSGLVKRLL